MYTGFLEIEILIDESRSLKDKRSIVKSLKDRLHREHMVSVAEVAGHDHHRFAVLGVTVASSTAKRADEVINAVARKISGGTNYRVGGSRQSVRSADELFRGERPTSRPEWDEEDDAEIEALAEKFIEESRE